MILETDGDLDGHNYTVRKLRKNYFDSVDDPPVAVDATSEEHLNAWTERLEAGDLVFVRRNMPWWNLTSQLIAGLDGFFSHVMLYVGDRYFVDATSRGVSLTPLEDYRLAWGDGTCIIAGRPKRPADERSAVARWARDIARPANDPVGVNFDMAALATAFAVLSKLRVRKALAHKLNRPVEGVGPSITQVRGAVSKAMDEMRGQQEEFDDPFERPQIPQGVCAGFVWQAYARNSTPLVPAFLHGTRISNGSVFGSPTVDPSVLEILLDEAPAETFGPANQIKSAFDNIAPLLREARVVLPALAEATVGTRRSTMLQMLGPNDLYCSGDIEGRFFLAAEHKTTALDWETEQKALEGAQVDEMEVVS